MRPCTELTEWEVVGEWRESGGREVGERQEEESWKRNRRKREAAQVEGCMLEEQQKELFKSAFGEDEWEDVWDKIMVR